MSSCFIFGFFELVHGHHMNTETKRGDGSLAITHHNYYESCVICSNNVSMLAKICKYSPAKEAILQDNTVAYVVAKVNILAGNGSSIILLKAWHVTPVPGNPASENYNASIPDFIRPIVVGLRIVAADHNGAAGGAVTFSVTVSDYI